MTRLGTKFNPQAFGFCVSGWRSHALEKKLEKKEKERAVAKKDTPYGSYSVLLSGTHKW